MIKLKLPFVLASGSPRRKEILKTMGIDFSVDVSDVDESFDGSAQDAVLTLSKRKAMAVSQRYTDAFVLAADTLVYADEIMGKPSSRENAVQMLHGLSGRWHSVFTGMTLIHPLSGKVIQRICETRVHFVSLSDAEIEAYVRSNEPLDKAGAYAIQGLGGMFVDQIEGSYSNVVGLPMSVLREMILEMNREIEIRSR